MEGLRDDLSQVVHPPLPAVGGGFTYTPAQVERSRIRAVAFSLTTSNVTASRYVALTLQDGSKQVVVKVPAPAAQSASQTDEYTFAMGLYPYSVSAAGSVLAPLPDLWLPNGGSVVVAVANVDAADAISKIRIVLDQVYLWAPPPGE